MGELSAKKTLGWLRQWLSLAAFSAIILCARASLADHYVVPSGSMEPTVEVGDRILVNKLSFGLRLPLTQVWLGSVTTPERGTVVVIAPPEEEGPVLLKRVVALQGDIVAVRSGMLSLNGRAVSISRDVSIGEERRKVEHLGPRHSIKLQYGGGPDLGPIEVPAGKMLVMGDNRGNSRDGRSFGFVEIDSLLGEAIAVYRRGGEFTWQSL